MTYPAYLELRRRDEDDAPGEKPKHAAWDDEAELLIGDDGELSGGNETAYQRLT